jgi:hypothetical protein
MEQYLVNFSYFEKMKLVLWYHLAVYVCVCICIPPINFRMPEPVFMKLCMYIMAPDQHLNGVIHKSLQSVIPILHTLKFLRQNFNANYLYLLYATEYCRILRAIVKRSASHVLHSMQPSWGKELDTAFTHIPWQQWWMKGSVTSFSIVYLQRHNF